MELQPGTKVTDNVTLVRRLGEGAMGEVWVGEHERLKTRVAVKFISEEVIRSRGDAAERFTREATAAAQIKSPHVVQMFDHGVMADGSPYIVMEMLFGESLHERIDHAGWLSIEDTGTILTHVGRALTVAHKLGVIHRDIKPHNIFLMEMHGELFVKVLDFGIAKQNRLPSSDELTEPGTIIGTPQYVSRDIIMGDGSTKVDELVDLWSMAVAAYKCMTTVLPFDGDSLGEICAAVSQAEFDAPSSLREGLPARYDRWFERALHPEPKKRFATAAELAETFCALAEQPDDDPVIELTSVPLDELEDDDDAAWDEPTEEALPPTDEEKRPWPTGLVAIGALALVAIIAIAVSRMQATTQSTASGASVKAARTAPPFTASSKVPASTTAAVNSAAVPTASGSTHTSSSGSSVPSAAPSATPGVEPRSREVAIPSGSVWMGCNENVDKDCDADELPAREVTVAGFVIDRTEVRVVDYAKCVVDDTCSIRRLHGYELRVGKFVRSTLCNWGQPRREKHPINCVDHAQAQQYCEWRASRLPTEAEWERAARGDTRHRFPWGEEDANCLLTVMSQDGEEGCGSLSTWQVELKARDVSPFGLRDMGGNLREWMADWYTKGYYRNAPKDNPRGPKQGTLRSTRGGSWGDPPLKIRTSAREGLPPDSRSVHVGFRCARSK